MPPKHKKQATTLLEQFNSRGNELTWNSDGVIFIDQVSIPNSDIFLLFPYLFKAKQPKNLNGFQDFVQKLSEMGLDHLITARKKIVKTEDTPKKTGESPNWYYLG